MNPLLGKLAGGVSKIKWKVVFLVGLALVVFFVFGKQLNKLLAWVRSRFQGAVVTKSVTEKTAQNSGTSADTVKKLVRQETCKGVASAVFAALHTKALGFLPRAWFGSTEDEDEVVRELNSLQNGMEASFTASYYFEKYQARLKDLCVKYVDNYRSIRAEIWNNLN
jgi:hypothetical protein